MVERRVEKKSAVTNRDGGGLDVMGGSDKECVQLAECIKKLL